MREVGEVWVAGMRAGPFFERGRATVFDSRDDERSSCFFFCFGNVLTKYRTSGRRAVRGQSVYCCNIRSLKVRRVWTEGGRVGARGWVREGVGILGCAVISVYRWHYVARFCTIRTLSFGSEGHQNKLNT